MDLGRKIAQQILAEQQTTINKVVVYAGRFQPFHLGHYKIYEHLTKKFGKRNVYIASSNKTDNDKSPFTFNEKKSVMTKLFGVPANKIVQIKNPYAPKEVLDKQPKDTAFITVVGAKDASRLGGKYFERYKDHIDLLPYADKGYVYISPNLSPISGTEVRDKMGSPSYSLDIKKSNFKQLFGKFDKNIFDLIVGKLTKDVVLEWIANSGGIHQLLEASVSAIGPDDGPSFLHSSYENYSKASKVRSKKFLETGWSIIDTLIDDDVEFSFDAPIYPNGPVDSISYYPAGDIGVKTATNQQDYYSAQAYSKWKQHITRVVSGLGWQFAQSKQQERITKKFSIDGARGFNKDTKEVAVNEMAEMAKSDVTAVDSFADKQLNPFEVDLSGRHFFERLLDPRNIKPISKAELLGFFKRLAKNKKKLVDFLTKYREIVVHDKRTDINIPFMKVANELIAKTIMRKADFRTSNPKLAVEMIDEILQEVDTQPLTELKAGLYVGALNIGGKRGDVVVDLKGADNKTNSYVTTIVDIPNEFKHVLKVGQPLNIPATKWRRGTWRKFVAPNAFEVVEEEIEGGLADNLTVDDIAEKHGVPIEQIQSELEKGLEVEQEHTDSEEIARGIALDHLTELPDYYTRLATIEEVDDDKLDIYENYYKNLTPEGFEVERASDHIKITPRKKQSLDEITQALVSEIFDDREVLEEGGGYGHLAHPFESDINLSFGQLKDIANKALNGELTLAREKTDGVQLSISWRDDKGGIIGARNKSHLKNRGENAMSPEQVISKFAGRGKLSDAYAFAIKDLDAAISRLSAKQRDKVFKQGENFMSLEVIYPGAENVIPYGQPLLVFHGTLSYDEAGNPTGESAEAGRMLAGMIKQINQDVQNNYSIKSQPVIELPKQQNLKKRASHYISRINKLQREFNLKDSDGVLEYHRGWWRQYIEKNVPEKLSKEELEGLTLRWADGNKKFRLDKKNLSSDKNLSWAKTLDKKNHSSYVKENLMKFEDIFLSMGAEILQFVASALVVNPNDAMRKIKKDLDSTVKAIESSKDERLINKLKLELRRLESLGGVDKLVPVEGIVFTYQKDGQPYTMKLTGGFAPLNQILGLMYNL